MLIALNYFFFSSIVFWELVWYIFLFFILFSVPFFFLFSFNSFFMSKNMFISLDLYSFVLLILTLWLIFLSLFSSLKIMMSNSKNSFLLCFLLLLLSLVLTFISSNLMFFFFFFESTVVPTLFVILGWGNKIERLKSGMYLYFYTLVGSLPLLSSIFFVSNSNNTLEMSNLEFNFFFSLIYFFSIFGFLIKVPMFFVHSWLPKAHVEAPVSGSMILAGVLLKLGGYGIFRFFFIYKYFLNLNLFWMYISLWGGLLTSIFCLRQSDMKSLVALSSVSHMSIVIIGLLIFTDSSIFSSFLMMFAHGLCSSALFYLINVVYERSGTRSIYLNKGLMSCFPSLSLWWFLFCACNMSAPPSLNILSEIFLINNSLTWLFFSIYILMSITFFTGAYSLFLFSFSNHGKSFSGIYFFSSSKLQEFYVLFLHWLPLNLLFSKLDLFF